MARILTIILILLIPVGAYFLLNTSDTNLEPPTYAEEIAKRQGWPKPEAEKMVQLNQKMDEGKPLTAEEWQLAGQMSDSPEVARRNWALTLAAGQKGKPWESEAIELLIKAVEDPDQFVAARALLTLHRMNRDDIVKRSATSSRHFISNYAQKILRGDVK